MAFIDLSPKMCRHVSFISRPNASLMLWPVGCCSRVLAFIFSVLSLIIVLFLLMLFEGFNQYHCSCSKQTCKKFIGASITEKGDTNLFPQIQ